MAEKPTGFERNGARRIIRATQYVERSLGPQGLGQQSMGRIVPPTIARPFQFISHDGDCILCNPYNQFAGSVDTSTTVRIAKPYKLRRTPFDGETVNGFSYAYASDEARTSTDTSDDSEEDQVIVPAYDAGDIVYAMGMPATSMDGNTVSLLDINADGRAWAMDE